MGFIFALLLMGLPLLAAYVDLQQAKGVKKIGGFDLPTTGGYTPKWDRPAATAPASPVATSPVVAPSDRPASPVATAPVVTPSDGPVMPVDTPVTHTAAEPVQPHPGDPAPTA